MIVRQLFSDYTPPLSKIWISDNIPGFFYPVSISGRYFFGLYPATFSEREVFLLSCMFWFNN